MVFVNRRRIGLLSALGLVVIVYACVPADQRNSQPGANDAEAATADEAAGPAGTFIALAGTGEASEYPRDEEHTLSVAGRARRYLVHLPAARTGLPVVFNLHGWGTSPEAQQVYSQFDAVADRERFIVVYPAALEPRSVWEPEQDEAFLLALIDELVARYDIDANRVYVVGYSAGGFAAHYFGASMSDRLAAIASVAGLLPPPELVPGLPRPGRPVPVLMLHNPQDQLVPYDAETPEQWARWNECPDTPQVSMYSDEVTLHLYAPCAASVEVRVYLYYGEMFEGHFWPWHAHGIDAAQVIWEFFRAYRLAGRAEPAQ